MHGATYEGKKCGSLGDVAAFSFFANKIATTGEGGMVVTDDDEIAEKCRYHKNLCFPLMVAEIICIMTLDLITECQIFTLQLD